MSSGVAPWTHPNSTGKLLALGLAQVIRLAHDPPVPSVLIVEDEKFVRMLAVYIVTDLGLGCFEAGDADEALFTLAVQPDIGVLFTDISMPGSMDGMELASRVHQARPEVGIIITSGVRHISPLAVPGGGIFLPKPFQPQQLVGALKRELARAH